MGLTEVIEKAAVAEELGNKMYVEQAEKATNPLARRLLLELASDEGKHATWLRSLLEDVRGGQSPDYPDVALPDIETRMKAVFLGLDATAKAQGEVEQEDVLKAAISLEKDSYRTYDDLFHAASESREKEFYDKLRRAEYEHLVALENILAYLTKTGMWFDIEESKRWNWMNI